jgi:hypothetical protein
MDHATASTAGRGRAARISGRSAKSQIVSDATPSLMVKRLP